MQHPSDQQYKTKQYPKQLFIGLIVRYEPIKTIIGLETKLNTRVGLTSQRVPAQAAPQ